jgi:hypothetical protein
MTQCGEGRSAQGTWGEPVGCLPYPSVALTSAVALRRSPRAGPPATHPTARRTQERDYRRRHAGGETEHDIEDQPADADDREAERRETGERERCPSRDQRAARVLAAQHPVQHDRTDEQPARRSARRAAPATGHPSCGPAAPWASRDGPSSSTPRRRGAGRRRASWRPRSGHNGCPTPLGGPRTTCAATGRPPRAGPWRRGRCGQACRVSERCTRC